MKILKTAVLFILMVSIIGCAATPTRRTFKEVWRDSAVSSRVKWDFGRDKIVSANRIKVNAWRGVVTLSGRTTDDAEKTKAEQVALTVKGVKKVRNYVDVVGPESVPVKVVKENVPFSKPKGKFNEANDISLPIVATPTTGAVQKSEIAEKNLEEEPVRKDGVSSQIGKELAATEDREDRDVTLQAEQELRDLKTKKNAKQAEPRD